MRDKIFYLSCFGFLFGVFLRSFLFLNLYFVILFSVISFSLVLFFLVSPKQSEGGYSISFHNLGILISVFILTFSFGILRFHMVHIPAPAILESKVGQKITLAGEIIDEPDIRENNQKLIVLLNPIGKAYGVRILLSASIDENYKYGDKIKFSGKLEKPENFTTDQGKEFDYINYLRKDGILYTMSYPKVEVVSHDNGNFFKSILFSAKEKFIEKMNLAIQSPESLLMGGLILGEKSAFSQALRESFVNTGTIHIIALSGYNVTIVAEWLMKFLAQVPYIPKNFGIGTGIFAIVLFIIMTGGSSTAIRAGVMATLALVARATGRNYDVTRALILAAVVMILINPFILVYDVSFQLSFIATVAVIFFAPRIEKYFMWVPEFFELRDIVTVTCAAYIFVMPFILYKMGNLSLVALPANILILPFIPFTMMLGFITGFAGLMWYVFAIPVGYISYLFLHYELAVISFFSNLPFAAFTFPNFPLIFTILIYLYFIYFLFWREIRKTLETNF